jgi:hypothetical protein
LAFHPLKNKHFSPILQLDSIFDCNSCLGNNVTCSDDKKSCCYKSGTIIRTGTRPNLNSEFVIHPINTQYSCCYGEEGYGNPLHITYMCKDSTGHLPQPSIFPVIPRRQIKRKNLADPTIPQKLLTQENTNKLVQFIKINKDIEIPDNFSWREKLGNNILPVRDQGQCGDCWAYSTTSALADRYAVKYDIMAPSLSVLWVVTNINYFDNKNTNKYSCEGNFPYKAFELFLTVGCKTDDCWPLIDNTTDFPEPLMMQKDNCCYNGCNDNNTSYKIYKIDGFRYLSDPTLTHEDITRNIQLEIMYNGPVVGSFKVFDDFYDFAQINDDDAVYIRNSNESDGWHAVEIVGWGKNSKGIRYWEIKNSWGIDCGINGYLKIAFTIDIPSSNNWCYLDIPSLLDGGVITCYPQNCQKSISYFGDNCNQILPLKKTFQINPVPSYILGELSPSGVSYYLILLPGPGADIVIDIYNYIKWGRLYDNDDGSNTDTYIHGCPSKASCDYVKLDYPGTYNAGRGYIFGTSGDFDLTINVYYKVKNKITNEISDLYHIYYDATCQKNTNDDPYYPFYLNGEGESRTYGPNFIIFPGDRVYIPPRIMSCSPPVVIAGIF